MSVSASLTTTFSIVSDCSVLADVEGHAEDPVDLLIDKKIIEKKVSGSFFDPQKSGSERVRLIDLQVDEVQNPLRAGL